jgi:lipid A disaccharide synthetase
MIKELIIEDFTVENMKREITELLKKEKQEEMKKDYQWLRDTLGYDSVSDKAATLMLDALQKKMLSANAQK